MTYRGLAEQFQPDAQGLVDTIMRRREPKRVHFIEIYHDFEIAEALAARFDLANGLRPDDPDFRLKRYVAIQRFSGFDYVTAHVNTGLAFARQVTEDTAGLKRSGGRSFQDEHVGPIRTWADFEAFQWPDPAKPEALRDLEWFEKNLPDDMCVIGFTAHFFEYLSWLMGYETLCFALYEQRDLVEAIARRLEQLFTRAAEVLLQFSRVRVLWGTDDMGFKTGLMISRKDMQALVFPGHTRLARMCHEAGRPYLLHACGNLNQIYDELIDQVRIDAKHSFEDTIEDVCDVKRKYGKRLSLLGGIDVDFLCRSDEAAIRERVRRTLDICQPGGGYCLGTGNSVANYIPLDNYLAMVDEGRLYGK
jgi:uroporphyrinogen decarboxylase